MKILLLFVSTLLLCNTVCGIAVGGDSAAIDESSRNLKKLRDDKKFVYFFENKEGEETQKKKGCKFVAKNKEKRCPKTIKGEKVVDCCPKTCKDFIVSKKPPTMAPTTFFPEGFEIGMATELAGMWVGWELYKEGNVTTPYSTTARFMPSTFQESNFLYWSSVTHYGGVDPLAGSVENSNYFGLSDTGLPWDDVLLDVKYKKCTEISEGHSEYDVTTNEMFKDFVVVATSSFCSLDENLLLEYHKVCELYLISRIAKIDDPSETYDVAVLTYGHTFEGYNNYACANRATFDVKELESDPNAVGSALLVRQAGFAPTPAPNLTDWECLH